MGNPTLTPYDTDQIPISKEQLSREVFSESAWDSVYGIVGGTCFNLDSKIKIISGCRFHPILKTDTSPHGLPIISVLFVFGKSNNNSEFKLSGNYSHGFRNDKSDGENSLVSTIH